VFANEFLLVTLSFNKKQMVKDDEHNVIEQNISRRLRKIRKVQKGRVIPRGRKKERKKSESITW